MEVQEDGRILEDDPQGRVVSDLVRNVLQRLLFANVDHRQRQHVPWYGGGIHPGAGADALRDISETNLRADCARPIGIGQMPFQFVDDDRQSVGKHCAVFRVKTNDVSIGQRITVFTPAG
jgi:hypothetical protein